VIAATNVNLEDAVQAKRFRLDLFYRLNVLPLHLPPLRERLDDLPELIDVLLRKALRRSSRRIVRLSDDALARMRDYPWPGNVRELENALEHACAIAAGSEIDVSDLPDSIQRDAAETPTSRRTPFARSGRWSATIFSRRYERAMVTRLGQPRLFASPRTRSIASSCPRFIFFAD
jgi:DNA-binding NtrC family response regulator